ncbi:MAG TPA: hypothetical protein VMB84_07990 [Stellaceae bacterium]|nr:hypothetical protein [Stellaceae bacterium]
MTRFLVAAAAFAASVGLAGVADAQPIPPPPSPYNSAVGTGPILTYGPNTMPPPAPADVTGTARRPVAATPECGPANPQGGVPTTTTWGGCP